MTAPRATRSRDFESYTLPDGQTVPSVSTILERTQSAEKRKALEDWRRRVGDAVANKKRDAGAARGTAFHSSVRRALRGQPTMGGVWLRSVEHVLPLCTRVLPIGDIGAADGAPVAVWNEIEGYAGTPDLIAEVDTAALLELARGNGAGNQVDFDFAARLEALPRPCIAVLDWKSWDSAPDDPSRPRKKYRREYTHDHRQQVAAYAKAAPLSHPELVPRVDAGFVIVALPERQALVFPVDLEVDYDRFAERCATFRRQQAAQARVDEARAEREAVTT